MRRSLTSTRASASSLAEPWQRILIIMAFSLVGFVLIVSRLFYLQVIRFDHYQKKAVANHSGESPLQARRGEIFIKDYASGENVRVATNITMDTLFVDPSLVKDPKVVADRIVPLIFDEEEMKAADQKRIEKELKMAKTEEEKAKIKPKTKEELYKDFYEDILDRINLKIANRITLKTGADEATLNAIKNSQLPGIKVIDSIIYAYPLEIQESDRESIAQRLAPHLQKTETDLINSLKGINRYIVLKTKLKAETSAKIREIIFEDATKNKKVENRYFNGLGLQAVTYRFYPENTLAANVLGYMDIDGVAQYGIENSFNSYLQGKNGIFRSQLDASKRQITVGDVQIEAPKDGANIVLTIDRALQAKIETMLANAVNRDKAVSGQVIIVDPKTGKIMAMAHYPTFNPNSYSQVTEKEVVHLTEEEIQRLTPHKSIENAYVYEPKDPRDAPTYLVFREKGADGQDVYTKFKNTIGAEAFQNKAVSHLYEPGSVFKTITMASAIEDGDVTPNQVINDPGERFYDQNKYGAHIGPDGKRYDAKIVNVAKTSCRGRISMGSILMNSCNTGISYVAHAMGRPLFYDYILRFGFNERTDIEFVEEPKGKIDHYDQPNKPWTDGELATIGFGQGRILVTPIQMIMSYAAIANDGVLMRPYIVESMEEEGKVTPTEPKPVRRVISEKTAETIKNMLVNNVEHGASYVNNVRLKDYYLAAKTGTAQTVKRGKYQNGPGTTIVNIVGFAPVNDPQFVIFAKMDLPRRTEWADETVGVLFKDIAAHLFKHFNIPPDKEVK